MDLPDADCLLIVPPFAHLTWPALGVHVLQAQARARGVEVAVLYANAHYAARIGEVLYAGICNAPMDWFLGERLFARAAWGHDPLDDALRAEVDAHDASVERPTTRYIDHLTDASGAQSDGSRPVYGWDALQHAATVAGGLVDDLGRAIAGQGYAVVGASSMFEQNAASIALLAAVKRHAPETVTVLGGPNCDGEMAEGLAGIAAGIDVLFSGEADDAFPEFVASILGGSEVNRRIVRCTPCRDLDVLAPPRFDEFFDQVARLLPALADVPLWITYETSRGCWWGERSHCTFCGLNGQGMGFREKAPDKVISEMRALADASPTRRFNMTDNIMPWSYHRDLLPRLAAEVPGAHVFYEQKANLDLERVKGLVDAGVRVIQPGIESLSTAVLRRMRKGEYARQNIALLRYARAVGLAVKWNLLYGFPGDDAADYEAQLALVPLVCHLVPPLAVGTVTIARFSPYFDRPGDHGVSQIEARPGYASVYPEGADIERIAYHFAARYPSGSLEHPEVIRRLKAAVEAWREAWIGSVHTWPTLLVRPAGDGSWVLLDTRGLPGAPQIAYLTTAQARAVLVGAPNPPHADWAVRSRYAVRLDGWCVPLAVAPYDVLRELERTEEPAAAGVVRLASVAT